MTATLLILFFALLLLGAPIICALMGSALISFLIFSPRDLMVVPQILYTANSSFALLAIPLFVLSGALMSGGGISKRLVNLFKALIGWIPGGLAVVTVVTCAFFGALSGSAPATVAAIGGIMIPHMREDGYDIPWTTCLMASSGSLGALIPPSIPLILYGVLTGSSVTTLFCAGIGPGIFVAICYIIYCVYYCKKNKVPTVPRSSGKEIWRAFVDAIWALFMPVIVLGGIYSGLFTPTEAAAASVVYGLVVGIFIYREIKISSLPKLLLDAGISSAAVMMILSTSSVFATVLTRNNIPTIIGNKIIELATTPMLFWLMFSVFMLLLGMFMSVSPAMIILTPILAPAAFKIGIHPIHFGVVFVIWMLIGTITPPFGSDLFIACGISKISTVSAFKKVIPFCLVYLFAVVILMAFPEVTLFLPKALGML